MSYGFMNGMRFILAAFILPGLLWAQDKPTASQNDVKPFPDPDFILRDNDLKPPKSGVVLAPLESDSKGAKRGTIKFYGEPHVSSLSFSGDGKILAVGYEVGRVDLWDVENHKKFRTFKRGSKATLCVGGRSLVVVSMDIELFDVATGKLERSIPRAPHWGCPLG